MSYIVIYYAVTNSISSYSSRSQWQHNPSTKLKSPDQQTKFMLCHSLMALSAVHSYMHEVFFTETYYALHFHMGSARNNEHQFE